MTCYPTDAQQIVVSRVWFVLEHRFRLGLLPRRLAADCAETACCPEILYKTQQLQILLETTIKTTTITYYDC